MADEPGNQTPDTPDVSETELRGMKVDQLRREAKEEGLSGTSGMRKGELVDAVAEVRQEHASGSEAGDGGADGPGADDDEIRRTRHGPAHRTPPGRCPTSPRTFTLT